MKSTCDISDQLHPHVQYLDPIFKSYGGKTAFSGRIVTIKCFEDNSLVEEALKMNGKGCVLVVDAGESLRCAMLGDKRASDAIKNEWEGIVVNGSIRDSVMINSMTIGIRALGVCPRKSIKKGNGKRNLTVDFSNVKFIPNHYLYADEDGVIVIENKVNS
ncbi:ribonuclease activity regulator protein RraA [Candidatus Pseudothioglobus singularis]|jgi:regulator of ribonuclease activity A|uniref:ribonuclease E activity regulator RraA n=1 Tax=Candidatus Pseudothioglobus singularis TaxID=1427364 RepID=UPI000365F5D5|nr:ribonuclease E activity regulator RraA [Candidatus Pseudothioglobus singularis]ANQ66506.1 ribonuclease activity regulator protein RraA [Candidatus Pseudothioglobus singularis]|tara:strand:- start:177 stop:656 length:480 start_codon:yes stop_codon:yes gene_type:complete